MGWTAAALAAAQDASRIAEGIYGYGAVGLCLVALAVWYIAKDRKHERRMDERLAREAEFQTKYEALSEKYRQALEKSSSVMDIVINLLKTPGKGGSP